MNNKVISLNIDKTLPFIGEGQIAANAASAKQCNEALHKGTGKGNDFLGWVNLPSSITNAHLDDIIQTANALRSKCEVVVVVGIGGSYLGARAIIESLSNSFDWLQKDRENPVIVYAGQNIGEDYLYELKEYLAGKSFGIINISKSGTTTEPALAFRILKQQLEAAVGKDEARLRIVAITDAARGALHTLAKQEGYKMYVIPDNVGGRFSVLTPVGLLPIAIAGLDIKSLIAGAVLMEKNTAPDVPFEDNLAEQYAVTRNELYKAGKKIEILANFNPKLHFIAEWWKQLYGESEGKENKGIFTAAVDFTTDLHSMGQWIQEGERSIFETVISVASPNNTLEVPSDEADLDGLNFLAGKRVDFVNKMAELGTQLAHVDGSVPNIKIEIPQLSEHCIGQLIYFFEKACGISGYMLGVNPFDQPGVEAYKKNMFALLNKPGFEKEHEDIQKRL
ncbi:glucose-6-phosphate isomerase [Dysgonomonas sp. PH5-45]|uniref:glucose-6-phosphate isomerase n=1 Tax=unclassified Dysgonomonas TaxID=2630389 RepID=UPI00247343F2|nr:MULTISPECIES: glucose-6-phosphate isomerase [unclassified Dysgonomonas]MDH6354916.1 glucose-6-phosphate isomerase [Dysgonomonas sp. PH5-45]MDH6387815.1 glucose-6-phosphate isomerase [Dysgonomonas sp. PH5-37]